MTEVKCLTGDSMFEWTCKGEDEEISICGHCQSCVLSDKLYNYTQWLQKAGGASQQRFLTGILVRCQNLHILENLQGVLQVTTGKDFTYARSRAQPRKPEDTISTTQRMGRTPDAKMHGMDMLETWEWFRKSPSWTKSNYLLSILSFCDTSLLHMLGNLVRVLIVWEKHKFLQFSNADIIADLSVTESRFSYHSDDHPDLDLLFQACSLYEPVDLPQETQQGSETDVFKQECLEQSKLVEPIESNSKPLIFYTNVCYPAKNIKSFKSSCEEMYMQSVNPWNTRRKHRDSDCDSSDDPALTVVPRSSKSLSGVSRHRDLIRSLPVDIAKRILGLLDKASLYSCKCVSKHWRCLTEEILTEMEVKKSVEKQAMILQGNSTSKINPFYAKICEVQVPISEEEKHLWHGESFPKYKVEKDFRSVYTGIKTKTVQMEERNVYCGVYNILVLLEREDSSRVMHYAGGQFVAIGSRDRTVRLLDVASLKEVPPVFQGHAGSVRAVLVCEERDLVISASYDLSIRCWNLKSGVCTMIFHGHFGTINCLDLYGDRLVSGAKDCRVKVWNLLTGKSIDNLKFKHLKPIMCVKTDESLVISSCTRGLVRMWSIETASLMRQISGHKGAVLCLCLDQWHILSGGSDGVVKAWSTNCNFKKSLMSFQHPKEVLTMCFLFLRVITGCMDGKIRIFNFLNGDCMRVIKTNMQQSPVLSLHTHNNIVMVNTRDSTLMLQFTEVHWDYSASAVRDFLDWSHLVSPECALRSSERTRASPSSPKSLKHAQDTQQVSRRAATWSKLQAYRRSRAAIELQNDFFTKHRPVLSAGRPVSGHSKDFQSRVIHTQRTAITSLDKKTSNIENSVLSQSEKAFRDRVRKRGPYHPSTLDLTLLRTNCSQQSQYGDLARSNLELNARVRDAWGPCHPGPSIGTQYKDSASLIPQTPLSHKLMGQRSLQSRQTCFITHSPDHLEAECPKGSPPKQSHTSLKVRAGINKIGPLITTSQEDGKAPQRLFMRRTSMVPHCPEDFDMTSMSSTYHNPLDPFREQGTFQLRTDTQLEEFIQEQSRQQQIHTHGRGDHDKTFWKHSYCPQ
ncbi:F-box and WD repeat domain containing protein 10B [Myxocyprinus asiaticus]|uniref:F-box and WD repeat domain containing protein 10B n=1 Tax=Myxocyprinus asiaticus TaxID=70543 RepID=UPI002223757D|nr:F-box and WD repeat domain containing protein 10B [Myxocyprinus asiaticus]